MPNARLLLVVDEGHLKDLQASLKSLGYKIIDCISNGQQALDRIKELKPDLVLVSIHLKGELGGIQFGEQIYEQYDLPVIYVSQRSSQTTIRRSGGTTPFGYLFEPTDEKHMLATIEVALARHGMELKLRESQQWLDTIVSCISDGLIATDLEDRIRFMNPVAEELLGTDHNDVIDKPIMEVLSLVYMNSDESVSLSHAMAYFQNQNLRTGFEAVLIRKDGGQIPIELFISPLSKKSMPMGMVLAFRDISDRKRALEEIRLYAMRSEALLKAAEQLNARLDVKAVMNAVCEVCNKSLNTTATSAFLYDPSKNALVSTTLVANSTVKAHVFDVHSFNKNFEIPMDLLSNILSPSNPVIAIKDIQAMEIPGIPYMNEIEETDVRSLAISGIYQNNALTGILVAQMHGTIRDFSQGDLELLRGLTDQASIAVGNAILFEQVVISRERQQALTRRLVDVQEDERRNLARELHDQIGQMMTGLQFSLSSLLPKASIEQREKIEEIQKLVSNLIAQTREISLNLRPSMLDDTGLILTLIWHFDRYTAQTDIKVNFQHYNLLNKNFDAEIETTVFRIIQEALTNAARYAKTESVAIDLRYEEQMVKIEIEDHGQGFDLDKVDYTSHMGLSSMRERAYAVGGLLDIHTAPGRGTHIHVIIPLLGNIERRQRERHRFAR